MWLQLLTIAFESEKWPHVTILGNVSLAFSNRSEGMTLRCNWPATNCHFPILNIVIATPNTRVLPAGSSCQLSRVTAVEIYEVLT